MLFRSVISLLQYLSNTNVLNNVGLDVFDTPRPKRNILAATAPNLFCRMFQANCAVGENEHVMEEIEEVDNSENGNTSLAAQLELSIRDAMKCPTSSKKIKADTNSKSILKEMALFELTKSRTSNLELLYKALIGIPVTSIEAERSFSASELFVTKLRSSLKYDTLDAFCMLRAFYMSKK